MLKAFSWSVNVLQDKKSTFVTLSLSEIDHVPVGASNFVFLSQFVHMFICYSRNLKSNKKYILSTVNDKLDKKQPNWIAQTRTAWYRVKCTNHDTTTPPQPIWVGEGGGGGGAGKK